MTLPLILGLTLLAQASSPVGTSASQEREASGRVLADETGLPLPNVRVTVTSPDQEEEQVVLADRDGRFAFSAPSDRYDVKASKAGYAPAVVRSRRTDSTVEIRLHRASIISGRVLDQFGEPVVAARVVTEALPGSSGGAQAETDTDDNGEYRLTEFAAGSVLVAVVTADLTSGDTVRGSVRATELFGQRSTKTYYPGVSAPGDAQAIHMEIGESRSGIDFSLQTDHLGGERFAVYGPRPATRALTPDPARQDTAAIDGQVMSTTGRPIPHAQVRLLFGVPVRVPVRTARADDDGRFRFEDLPEGQFQIAVAKPGFTALDPHDFAMPFVRELGSGPEVKIEEGEKRKNLEIKLVRLGTITGRVVDELGEPVERASMQALRIEYQAGRRWLVPADTRAQLSDDRGQYRLYGLPPGDYVLSASVNVPGYAKVYYPGTPDPAEAQFVSLGSSEIAGIDLAFTRTSTARVRGKILSADGEVTTGGAVSLRPASRSASVVKVPIGAEIFREGGFEFPHVPDGQYVIVADRGRRNSSTEGEFGSLAVTVAGGDVSGLVLQMSAGSSISGRVRFDTADGTTTPAPGAIEISPVPVDQDLSPSSIASAEIAGDWTFSMAGINGPRRLQVVRVPPQWALKEVFVNGIDVTDRPLVFGRSDQSLSQVDVVLTDRVSRVAGEVDDDNGSPSAGAHMIIASTDRARWYPSSRFLRHVVAGGDGSFEVTGLPSGSYSVIAVARVPDYGEDAWQDSAFLDVVIAGGTRVTVTEGQPQVVRVQVRR
ncbi:MAG TPA: carboxypeptidase-like regulatory domain-containing protein [Vicinamibacterales bacterium]